MTTENETAERTKEPWESDEFFWTFAAQIWCRPENEKRQMDVQLGESIALAARETFRPLLSRIQGAPAMLEALRNAQEVIHLKFCQEGDAAGNKTCWKECGEAQDAITVAESLP